MAYTKSTDYRDEEIILARFAKALGHPARIAILKYLASLDACCFGDIHKELPIAKATVSQHLAELKDAGLIRGSIAPPRVNYCIDWENWEKARQLFGDFWETENNNSPSPCCQ
ncbi:MAG: metalloregulator ArsR/SmtB family transcription factor [Bacteroidota bacterium]|nr:metalloregulator ArsR/SmtB family transcription factor [Bacteroidota bacterium]MDP4227655.1 metalloregulator ArsR/SmtB family transcription factor [Bacteroidota bacterium]MDP4273977.1 metalloregulator ArsR/SmtB family transcription factor [Bacteroidota bacterium]